MFRWNEFAVKVSTAAAALTWRAVKIWQQRMEMLAVHHRQPIQWPMELMKRRKDYARNSNLSCPPWQLQEDSTPIYPMLSALRPEHHSSLCHSRNRRSAGTDSDTPSKFSSFFFFFFIISKVCWLKMVSGVTSGMCLNRRTKGEERKKEKICIFFFKVTFRRRRHFIFSFNNIL